MIWSYIKWFLIMLLYGLAIVTSYIVFPIAYWFRNWLSDSFLYFDKEHGFYGDINWRIERNLTKENFWCALKWSWRNPAWNFWLHIKQKDGERTLIKVIDQTNYTDWREDIFIPCQIKTVNDNYADTFSEKRSILGFRYIEYKINRTLYWNWSKAFEKKDGIFLEYEFGWNGKRPLANRIRKKLNR